MLPSMTMSSGLNVTFRSSNRDDVPLTSVLEARRWPLIPELSRVRMASLAVCMCGAESGDALSQHIHFHGSNQVNEHSRLHLEV